MKNLVIILSIIIIAAALAMDAFSVSITAGICIEKPDFGHYFRIAFHFGLFQFMMPIIGYLAGQLMENEIKDYDHWIAFALLYIILTIWYFFLKPSTKSNDLKEQIMLKNGAIDKKKKA